MRSEVEIRQLLKGNAQEEMANPSEETQTEGPTKPKHAKKP